MKSKECTRKKKREVNHIRNHKWHTYLTPICRRVRRVLRRRIEKKKGKREKTIRENEVNQKESEKKEKKRNERRAPVEMIYKEFPLR